MYSFDMRISLLIMLVQLQYLDPENCHAPNFELRSVCVYNGCRTTNYVIQDNFNHFCKMTNLEITQIKNEMTQMKQRPMTFVLNCLLFVIFMH